jgi:hypothetical protein
VSRARDVVTAAYAALERASDETSEASGLLRKAYDAALAGEKAHRRMGAGLGGHRESADTAARYFVVKWFLDPANITDARSACAVRPDCLFASALRAVLEGHAGFLAVHETCSPVASIDYTKDIVR